MGMSVKGGGISPVYADYGDLLKRFRPRTGDRPLVIMTGNAAAARGLIEAGVGFVSVYPGTPVSEIADYMFGWSRILAERNIPFIFDYAYNEKVALEEAIGAAWCGIRSCVIFKHLGLNVASDPFHTLLYSGIGGEHGAGLVIICGGDPGCKSSTNAQDIRFFAEHSGIPILFPSSVNELYLYVKIAFELSEIIDLPIMVYTTPALNFASAPVAPGKIKPPAVGCREDINRRAYFYRDMPRYVNAIFYAVNNSKKLHDKLMLLSRPLAVSGGKYIHTTKLNLSDVTERGDNSKVKEDPLSDPPVVFHSDIFVGPVKYPSADNIENGVRDIGNLRNTADAVKKIMRNMMNNSEVPRFSVFGPIIKGPDSPKSYDTKNGESLIDLAVRFYGIPEIRAGTLIITGGFVYQSVREVLAKQFGIPRDIYPEDGEEIKKVRISSVIPVKNNSDSSTRIHPVVLMKADPIYPPPFEQIAGALFVLRPEVVITVEESGNFIEHIVSDIAARLYPYTDYVPLLFGKNIFPFYGELTHGLIENGLKRIFRYSGSVFESDGIKFSVETGGNSGSEPTYPGKDGTNNNLSPPKLCKIAALSVPAREPTFCSGCGHRNVFYALRKAADKIAIRKGLDIIFGGDIGCYTMGMSSPYSAMDWVICMGAGLGIAAGTAKATAVFGRSGPLCGNSVKKSDREDRVTSGGCKKFQHTVSLIGDSTFFHSGIPALLNAASDFTDLTLIILNNGYIAMTGHQPSPTSPPSYGNRKNETSRSGRNDPNSGIYTSDPERELLYRNGSFDLTAFLRSAGLEPEVLNGFSPEGLYRRFLDYFEEIVEIYSGHKKKFRPFPRVFIVNMECALIRKRKEDKRLEKVSGLKRGTEVSDKDLGDTDLERVYYLISESCPQCNECYAIYGCTAIKAEEDPIRGFKYIIDEDACVKRACGSCVEVCKNSSILKIIINPSDKSGRHVK